MIIALSGCMGSGKSTVGRALADLLGCRFVDLDEAVARKAGMPIPEIFAAEGEEGFRKRELKTLRSVLPEGNQDLVLSLGGGTLTIPAAATLIHEKTCCIYLRARLDTLMERLSAETEGRPLLQGADLESRLTALLEERALIYEKNAHAILDTDGLAPEEIAEEIIINCL